MAKIKIICDSAADIPVDVAENLGIRVLPLWYTFDGENYLADGIDMTKTEFFNKMREEKVLPKTSQVTAPQWEEAFREEIANGADSILCFTMSSAASGTCQSANIAKNEILADNPDADITIIDSMALSFTYGLAITKVAPMVNEGKTVEEIIAEYERIMSKEVYFFLVEDLEFLKKGGRINLATLALANIMDIKPVLTLRDGLVVSCDKIRGGKRLYDKFMQMYKDKGYVLEGKDIFVVHSLTEDKKESFVEAAKEAFNPASVTVLELGSTIGAHAGPGLSAVVYIKD